MKKILLLLILLDSSFCYAQLDYLQYKNVFYDEFEYPDPGGHYPSHAFKNTTGVIPVANPGIGVSVAGHKASDFWDFQNGNWGGYNEHYSENRVVLQSPGIIRFSEIDTPAYPLTRPGGTIATIVYESGYMKLNQAKMATTIPDARNYGYGVIEARMSFPTQQPDIPVPDPPYTATSTCPAALWLGGIYTELDMPDAGFRGTWMPLRTIDWSLGNGASVQPVAPPNTSAGFHTYTAEWTPSIVRYYIDNVLVNTIGYETMRTYPSVYNVEIGLGPEALLSTGAFKTAPGQYMDIDWVKTWVPACATENLIINQADGITAFYVKHPANGRFFKQPKAFISAPTLLTLRSDVPTVIEADAVTINPNFLADQSSYVSTTVASTSDVEIQPTPFTRIGNAYFEARAAPCASNYQSFADNRKIPEQRWANKNSATRAYQPDKLPVPAEQKEGSASGNQGLLQANVFPNPSDGLFTLSVQTGGSKYDICITDLSGTVVFEQKNTTEQKLDLQLDHLLPPGNYTIQISCKDARHVEQLSIVR